MSKAPLKNPSRRSAAGRSASRVLGTTTDGVKILKPKGRATHFTDKEIRDAIATVIAARTTRAAEN
jgi:hypothetical protein